MTIGDTDSSARVLAFYLPQFHPIPENDEWWGPGFTEWRAAATARPRFRGHYQPHIPADLGFYDLRLGESRTEQADLARRYGVSGFVYYHYWFSGRRLLNRPIDAVLQTGAPDFPFCLCWANENWTRAWDGLERNVLLAQTYSPADDLAHIRYLCEVFEDPRYIRIGGRPLMLVYHASELPDPIRTTETWRTEAMRLGVNEPFLCRVEVLESDRGDPAAQGFDAGVEFQPDGQCFGNRLFAGLPRRGLRRLLHPESSLRVNSVHSYGDLVNRSVARIAKPYAWFRCVTPSWDNSPRRRTHARILHGSTPRLFQAFVTGSLSQAQLINDEVVLFVNAWNEWGEGNHLEPDLRWGHGYLAALQAALAEHRQTTRPARVN